MKSTDGLATSSKPMLTLFLWPPLQQEGRAYLSDVVDDVIELLGLRHVQHSVVGSVEKRGVRRAF